MFFVSFSIALEKWGVRFFRHKQQNNVYGCRALAFVTLVSAANNAARPTIKCFYTCSCVCSIEYRFIG